MIYGLLTTLKFGLASFYKLKKRTDFYNFKKFFIRSGYCKLLLNQGSRLLVINMKFSVPVFQLLLDSSTEL